MRTMTADDARRDWLKLASEAKQAPVRVLDETGTGLIVLSEGEFKRMRGESRDRLKQALARMHREVEESGLEEKEIEALMADEAK